MGMSHSEKLTLLPPDFNGNVRLFPLPNLVMFPHVVQPLHVFEPRYCELLEDALATDNLIAMALLQPGWEQDYEGRPPLEDVVCVGRVVSHARLPENRHNLLLLGLARARITHELPATTSFRRARVKVLADKEASSQAQERDLARTHLVDLFRQLVPGAEAQQQLDNLLSQDMELGRLADIVAFTTGLDCRIKQRLLAETNVDRRAAALTAALQEALKRPETILHRVQSDWPPPFSAN
jgi:ATP-dependent Lon protease